MFYVYLLKSLRDGNAYIGSTDNLRRRLAEHQKGLVVSTKPRRPFFKNLKVKSDVVGSFLKDRSNCGAHEYCIAI